MSSIDEGEVSKFAAMAADWWDPNGKARPLHQMNPCRLDYIAGQIAVEFARDRSQPKPFEGLTLADIGCGGGLLCEPMARLGADVTGADAALEGIQVARLHAEQMELEITYRHATAEALVEEGAQFDVVLAMEIIEHVAEPAAFVRTLSDLVKPGGLLIMSTLNRTPQSYAMAIVGAEYILRWLPVGTHEWQRFVTPDELGEMIDDAGLKELDRRGMVFNPLTRRWKLSDDLAVNYALTARKAHG
ncbi:bifunctional 2-polyprenyl-6-hydroxyphenol methylase/3-demethylubiquinol 3-O-methyltransferase UbiG [Paracoccaceae bacterium GXU_MW_L88]